MATLAREDENRDAVVYWNDLARQAQPGGLLRPDQDEVLDPTDRTTDSQESTTDAEDNASSTQDDVSSTQNDAPDAGASGSAEAGSEGNIIDYNE
jgi:hypothetical protein